MIRSSKGSRGTWVVVGLVIVGVGAALAGLKWRRMEPEKPPLTPPASATTR